MISKAFQNIVAQMAEVFPRRFGIADAQGLVLASNGNEVSEDIIEELVYAVPNDDKIFFKNGYTVRLLSGKP